MTMLSAVEQEFGTRIHPVTFVNGAASIGRLAELLSEHEPAELSPQVIELQSSSEAPPLYVTATVGGLHLHYADLAKALRHDRQLLGLQPTVLVAGSDQQTRIESLASQNIALLRQATSGPVQLLGYSFGALTAFEMAHQLLDRGDPPDRLILIDPPVTWVRSIAARRLTRSLLRRQGWASIAERFVKVTSAMRGQPGASVSDACTAAALSYRPRPLPLDRVLLLVAAEGADRRDILRHWPKLLNGEASVRQTPGDHLSSVSEPEVVHLAEQIAEWLG